MSATSTIWLTSLLLGFTTSVGLAMSWVSQRLSNSRMRGHSYRLQPRVLRSRRDLFQQIVVVNMVGVLAGAVAGLGASLFVDDGRLRFPTEPWPVIIIGSSVMLVLLVGSWTVIRLSRPEHERYADAEMLSRATKDMIRAPTSLDPRELRRSRQFIKRRMWSSRIYGPRDRDRYLKPGISCARQEWLWVENGDTTRRPSSAHDQDHAQWRYRDFRRQMYRGASWRVVVDWAVRGPSRFAAALFMAAAVIGVCLFAISISSLTFGIHSGSLFRNAWTCTAGVVLTSLTAVAYAALLGGLARETAIRNNRVEALDLAYLHRAERYINQLIGMRSNAESSWRFTTVNWELILRRRS